MKIPTGDYLVEFLDFRGEVVPGASVLAVSLGEAREKARGLSPLMGLEQWRIMRCVDNSTDKGPW